MESIWHIIGASVQGTSHQERDIPCQDAHAYRLLPEGVALVAVADGAGSAERSDEGARWAVEHVIASVQAGLAEGSPEDDVGWEALLTEAFIQAGQALVQRAEAEDALPRDFATTLTCALVSHDRLAVGQIGDGIVVAKGKDGGLFAAVLPQRGEYANETFFLTTAEALQQLEVQIYTQPIEALAVMTDGLIRLAINLANHEPHSPFFQPLMLFAAQAEDEAKAQEQLAELLASERVGERTDDDKTLVLVARPSAPEPQDGAEGEAQAADHE